MFEKIFHPSITLPSVTVLYANEFRWIDQLLFHYIHLMNLVASKITSIQQHCRQCKILKVTLENPIRSLNLFMIVFFSLFITHQFTHNGGQSNQVCQGVFWIQYDHPTSKSMIVRFSSSIFLFSGL